MTRSICAGYHRQTVNLVSYGLVVNGLAPHEAQTPLNRSDRRVTTTSVLIPNHRAPWGWGRMASVNWVTGLPTTVADLSRSLGLPALQRGQS